MEIRDAINILENYKSTCNGCEHKAELGCRLNLDCSSAIDMAIESLEKQIPQRVIIKPIEHPVGDDNCGYCPRCGAIVNAFDEYEYIVDEYPYCKCGQKILWDERRRTDEIN